MRIVDICNIKSIVSVSDTCNRMHNMIQISACSCSCLLTGGRTSSAVSMDVRSMA